VTGGGVIKVEKYLTVDEVAETLQLQPYTVRRLSREDNLPAFKIGGQWRFNKEELDRTMKHVGKYGFENK